MSYTDAKLRSLFEAYCESEGLDLDDEDRRPVHVEWFVASAADGEIDGIDEDDVNDFPDWEERVLQVVSR